MRAFILLNGYARIPSAESQARRIKEELEILGVECDILRHNFFGARVIDGKVQNFARNYDFCVYLDKDKYLSAALEKTGLRLFNSHSAIRICDDKAETHLTLAGHGIPMPKTISGLLCYEKDAPLVPLDEVIKTLGLPVVIKECYGSLGKGVYKANDETELKIIAEKLRLVPHLFQEYIEESAGRDIRAITIGGEVIAAMERKSQGDFRSNLGLGGNGTPLKPNEKIRELCRTVTEIIGLDYCGIDLLFGRDDYLLCEVNSNAFFGGIEKVTGINVARAYVEHILKEMR